MDVRCIALDLDGTTLNKESCLSSANREAIEYVLAKGIHVIVASGRAFFTLPSDITNIHGIAFAVTSNGAAVYDVPGRKVLMRRYLPEESVEHILSISKASGVTYEAFVNGVAYADAEYILHPDTYGAYGQSIAYLQATRKPIEGIEEFILENRAQLDSIDVICWNHSVMEQLRERFAREMPEAYLTSSSDHRLEFSHPESGKRAGVEWVLNHLGLKASQMVALGDGDNDAELLQFAGCGIAVANATSVCRASADYLSVDHDADAIAYAIHDILQL